MGISMTTVRWALPIIILHWFIAAAIVGLYILGDYMVDLDYYDSWYQSAPFWHKSVGLTVFAMVFLRILTRLLTHRPPEIANSRFKKLASRGAHVFLYVAMIVVCVSGYLISTAGGRPISVFGLFDLPATIYLFENQEDVAGLWHEWAALALVSVALLHAVAALKHHFLDRDVTLLRMMGLKR